MSSVLWAKTQQLQEDAFRQLQNIYGKNNLKTRLICATNIPSLPLRDIDQGQWPTPLYIWWLAFIKQFDKKLTKTHSI